MWGVGRKPTLWYGEDIMAVLVQDKHHGIPSFQIQAHSAIPDLITYSRNPSSPTDYIPYLLPILKKTLLLYTNSTGKEEKELL